VLLYNVIIIASEVFGMNFSYVQVLCSRKQTFFAFTHTGLTTVPLIWIRQSQASLKSTVVTVSAAVT